MSNWKLFIIFLLNYSYCFVCMATKIPQLAQKKFEVAIVNSLNMIGTTLSSPSCSNKKIDFVYKYNNQYKELLTNLPDNVNMQMIKENYNINKCKYMDDIIGIQNRQPLNAGSFGQIYTVQYNGSAPKHVDKIMRLNTTAHIKDFFNEINILKNSLGYSVVDYSDFYLCLNAEGIVEGHFIMEKYDGNLVDYIRQNKLTEENLLKILSAIQTFHLSRSVHRDLHLKNIVYKLNNKGEPTFALIDFGKSYHYKGNEKSPLANNFQGITGGVRFKDAAIIDIEHFVSDLKSKFNINVTVSYKGELIKPVSVPGHSIALVRAAMIEAYNKYTEDNPNNIDPQKNLFLKVNGRPMMKTFDPKLADQKTGKILEENGKLKFVIELDEN